MTSAEQAEAVTREIRACFNRMAALGDRLHRDLGVTTAMRAVMETLYENGEQTVPAIARAKRVTRQHIQMLLNRLIAAKLAATRPNPADRRSPLADLTAAGRTLFARMHEREKAVFADLTRALAGRDLDAALAALAALRAFLDDALQKGEPDS
jgi:DNA-binding MarR family transcriptional regulator